MGRGSGILRIDEESAIRKGEGARGREMGN